MSEETIRLVVAAAVALNLLAIVGAAIVVGVRWLRGRSRRRRFQEWRLTGDAGLGPEATAGWSPAAMTGAPEGTYDRIFRIAAWSFLVVTALIVAISGLWSERLPWIVGLLAAAGAAVLVVHDVLPAGAIRSIRVALQALVALTSAALLVLLTGGFGSPFFFAFPLIVGGAALVVPAGATVLIALGAATAYLASAAIASGAPTASESITAAVNLSGIAVFGYIAAAVGHEQRRSRDAAIRMSAVDSLTGLYSRPFLLAAIARELARSERTGRGFCLVMLDLDELKAINDQQGHHAGDLVLRAVADTLRSSLRRADVAARYSGDEFVALLPETDPTGAWVVAEKVRQALRERRFPGLDQQPTVSLGVVTHPRDGRSVEGLLMSADRAMYAAKRGGKDRVAGVDTQPTVVPLEAAGGTAEREPLG